MKILIKGNLIVDECIITLRPHIEETYHALGGNEKVNEDDYDMIINGNVDIHSMIVTSDEIKITITGYIMTL